MAVDLPLGGSNAERIERLLAWAQPGSLFDLPPFGCH